MVALTCAVLAACPLEGAKSLTGPYAAWSACHDRSLYLFRGVEFKPTTHTQTVPPRIHSGRIGPTMPAKAGHYEGGPNVVHTC